MNSVTSIQALQKIEEAYDSPPWWYDIRGFFILTFSYRSTLWNQVRFFARNISSSHLEAAVGTGTLLAMVLGWRRLQKAPAGRIAAFDYAEPMLAGARKRFKKNDSIRLIQADVAQLDFPDNTFESANIANAVHCFPDVDRGLREIQRVLKPGGRVAMNILLYAKGPAPLRWLGNRIAKWGIKKGILETPFERSQIERLIRFTGLEILESSETGNVLMLVARKPEVRDAATSSI